MKDIEIIREACIKANPELNLDDHCYCGRGFEKVIRLADVLLAIGNTGGSGYGIKGDISKGAGTLEIASNIFWNLREDLEGQPPETLSFLASLLAV